MLPMPAMQQLGGKTARPTVECGPLGYGISSNSLPVWDQMHRLHGGPSAYD